MLPAILKAMNRGGILLVAGGFTIVEVLIVLAVSGMLLISAVLLVNGRQSRTEFTTGINQIQQQLQQTINETASGFYPSDQNYTCHSSPSGPVTFTNSPKGQGTNEGCIFLGNAVLLGTGPSAPNSSMFGVVPLVGNQYIGGTYNPILTVGESVPRAAYPAGPGEIGTVPQNTLSTTEMNYGLVMATANNQCSLATSGACYVPATGPVTYVSDGIAAFIAGDNTGAIAANAASSSNLQSGSLPLSLYGVSASKTDDTPMNDSLSFGSLTRPTGPGNLVAAKEILVCVASQGLNQSALFTIGGSGDLSVSTKVFMGSQSC